MDIQSILFYIQMYEEALNEDLALSNVQMLTNLYQKAIEYYSSFDNIMYNDFLNRMQSLLSREDIQAVMTSISEEKVEKKPKKAPIQGKNIDFNVGEEEDFKQDPAAKKNIFKIGLDEGGAKGGAEEEKKEGEESDGSYFEEEEGEEGNQKTNDKKEEPPKEPKEDPKEAPKEEPKEGEPIK